MKRKVQIVLGVVIAAVVITIASSSFLLTENQPITIPYDGKLTTVKGYSGAYLSLYFHSGKTLFDCQVTVTYLAANGSSIEITKQLAVVDLNPIHSNSDLVLTDYPMSIESQQIPINKLTPQVQLQ